MEPEAKYTVVGVAVIALVGLLTAALLWLRSTGEGADAQRFKIYFHQQSLEGLEPRSDVTMRGMRVGSVRSFRFSSRQPGAVEVFISVDSSTPVRAETRAIVDRHLITGLATVRLENWTEDSPLLTEVPRGEPYPVIAEGQSSLQVVSQDLSQLVSRADQTLQRLNAVLSPANQQAFAETLENLRRLTQRVDASLAKADAALGSAGAAANELRTLARSVSEDARTLASRYDRLGTDATVTVQEIGQSMRKVAADVDRLTARADRLLAAGDEEIRASAQSLRSAAEAVGTAAGRLRDPRQLIFGPAEGALGPGEEGR
jgi:phospholipid/cholesterol/gamma-HCH transport system substrate-binding protein